MGAGGWFLFASGRVRDPGDVVVWLGGAILLHDAVIAPLVLGVWLLVATTGRALMARGRGGAASGGVRGGRVRGAVRGPLRGALIVGGCLTLIALPPLLRPGRPSNATALPLDYPRNWLIALGVTAACGLAVAALRLIRGRRGGGPSHKP
ncbi:hypothetical protein [Streptomyces sp. 8N616]|uniref:hypothetical protein n=1 Tax=Streptomyces sp. 8N616 TaxID=3457414 RepID=UPI003FD32DF5